MEKEIESRLNILVGEESLNKIKNLNIIIFGLGGVGSYAAEALSRSFINNITIVDFDTVSYSNLNRQLIANLNTIGYNKVDVMYDRIKSINEKCKLKKFNKKLCVDNIPEFELSNYDFVIDAIDDIEAKVALIRYCCMNKIKIISSMGMANKMNPEKIKIDKLENTKSCAIARKLRRELKDTNSAKKIPVIYSSEISKKLGNALGSNSFVPGTSGLFIASYIIRNTIK